MIYASTIGYATTPSNSKLMEGKEGLSAVKCLIRMV